MGKKGVGSWGLGKKGIGSWELGVGEEEDGEVGGWEDGGKEGNYRLILTDFSTSRKLALFSSLKTPFLTQH
uniref:Uncharacterized protein n=1 Tax=Desertifilum tharense IPPAS B-1220 TaxID=1781255 RepID=A0A1E5QIH7_9CYAN|nr:hypothetical protein BH720_14720 [Desertifilum tharense IPPAS B-1220]